MARDVRHTGSAPDGLKGGLAFATDIWWNTCLPALKFKCFCDSQRSFIIGESATMGDWVGNGDYASLGDLPRASLKILSLDSVLRVILDSHTSYPLGDPRPGEPRDTPVLSGWRSASVQLETVGKGVEAHIRFITFFPM